MGGSIYKYINGKFVVTNDLYGDEEGVTEKTCKHKNDGYPESDIQEIA